MIRLAIVNDDELVVAGVAAMLSEDRHPIRVTALAVSGSMDFLETLIRRSQVPVIVYSWKLGADTAREALDRGAAGMSNQEIADRSFLSINSVKTYIRSAYRKIEVRRRSQAVRWALDHGFVATPDTTAPTEPAFR